MKEMYQLNVHEHDVGIKIDQVKLGDIAIFGVGIFHKRSFFAKRDSFLAFVPMNIVEKYQLLVEIDFGLY